MRTNNSFYYDAAIMGKRADQKRSEQNLSIEELAKKADVNKNTVMRFIKGNGTKMETIFKICNALGISPSELFQEELQPETEYREQSRFEEESRRYSRGDREQYTNGGGIKGGHLNFKLQGGMLNAIVLEIETEGSVHRHNGEEFLFCLTGKIEARVGKQTFKLSKGDAIFFWASEAHQYINIDKKTSVALSVWIDPKSDIQEVLHGENYNKVTE